MKPLFTNYNYVLDKNERRVLSTFTSQIIKSSEGRPEAQIQVPMLESILNKLRAGDANITFTKKELLILKESLKMNLIHMKKELPNVGFFRKWLYKSLLKQYQSIWDNHFKD